MHFGFIMVLEGGGAMYKKMYLILFHATTDAMDMIEAAWSRPAGTRRRSTSPNKHKNGPAAVRKTKKK